MPAPRKYEQETRDRAVRMYQDRRRDPAESALQARRRMGELLDVKARHAARLSRASRDRCRSAARCAQPGGAPDQRARAGQRRAAPGERDPQDGVGVFASTAPDSNWSSSSSQRGSTC
jgi:hypothetical protein